MEEKVKPYFDGIKVGDEVYCYVRDCIGTVDAIDDDVWHYNIHVDFGSDVEEFTMNGQAYEEGNQVLFWSKPENKLTAPPKPKRKVKKKIEFWVNIYPYGVGGAYPSEELSKTNCGSLGFPRKFTTEIEIVEESE